MENLENCPFCGKCPNLGNVSPYGDDLNTYFCCGTKITSENPYKWNFYCKAIMFYKEKSNEKII